MYIGEEYNFKLVKNGIVTNFVSMFNFALNIG